MSVQKIRFGDFVREASISQIELSYNDLTPKLKHDKAGNELKYVPPKIKLQPTDVYRILKPYIGTRFMDQVRAVVPLAVYLFLFQILILRQAVSDSWSITGGLFAVMAGLMLFLEGLKLGLMPFGETIGITLPAKSSLPVVLLIAFMLGVGVTFAEPAIGALKTAGAIVSIERAPYLYALLNEWSGTLVLVVGAGVGLASILGTLRFIYGWSLKPLIYLSLGPTMALTAYMMGKPELKNMIALAWDCGAVTTGPVTVPLVLSLGIGVAAAVGKGDESLSGFGIVTLASLFPVTGALGLGVYLGMTTTPEAIAAAAAQSAPAAGGQVPWHTVSPWLEVIGGVQAIVPLVLFLFLVLTVVLRDRVRNAGIVVYGLTLAVVGMIVFNLGLTYGLAKLGGQSGSIVPAAFASLSGVAGSPLYAKGLGLFIAFAFAWFLGFGATLAEPALNALGITVENLTNGAFRKSLLLYSVSLGVAFGIGIGVLKIIYSWPLANILLPAYGLAIVLTYFSTEEFVNVAWDSAGVTTGPVTVPLVLAMGLGLGNAVDAVEGFGILSMASIGPILSVMACGLWVRFRERSQKES
jgi:hypothetical protein